MKCVCCFCHTCLLLSLKGWRCHPERKKIKKKGLKENMLKEFSLYNFGLDFKTLTRRCSALCCAVLHSWFCFVVVSWLVGKSQALIMLGSFFFAMMPSFNLTNAWFRHEGKKAGTHTHTNHRGNWVLLVAHNVATLTHQTDKAIHTPRIHAVEPNGPPQTGHSLI